MVNAIITCGLTVALCYCCGWAAADLADDILDFKSLIPTRRIKAIISKYYLFDAQLRQSFKFMGKEEFLGTLESMFYTTGTEPLKDYFEKYTHGEDLTPVINELYSLFDDYHGSGKAEMPEGGDISSFKNEFLRALPRLKFYNLVAYKMKISKPFEIFYNALRAPEFKELLNLTRQLRGLRRFIRVLKSKNIDIDQVISSMFTILSWGPLPKSSTKQGRRKL